MIRMPTEPTGAIQTPPRTTKFSLPANYDPKLIPALGGYPVDEVYGKFPDDGVSGGRPRYMATPLSEAELLRRVKAYSERRFDGNLAELLLSYGFKQPVRKESLWGLRHFWKPRQVNPLRMKPMLELSRLQGWLSPLPECPIRVDTRKIPEKFLDGFRDRDCASLDCKTCGYFERIAEQAVSIALEYRTEVLKKYEEMDETMATGRLWDV
jgi:hypothetical protein